MNSKDWRSAKLKPSTPSIEGLLRKKIQAQPTKPSTLTRTKGPKQLDPVAVQKVLDDRQATQPK